MNVQYKGSYRFNSQNTILPTVKLSCTIHDSPYINKKTMKCVIGLLKKQECKVELGDKK